MAAGLQDGTVLIFGTGAATTYGLIQSQSTNDTVETAESKGPDGHTVSIQQYDDKKELSLTFLAYGNNGGSPAEWVQGTSEPKIGTLFEYPLSSGVNYVTKSVNGTKTVDGFFSVDLVATKYNHI